MMVRPLNENDFSKWLPLWQSYLAFYQATLSEEVTLHTWQGLISRPNMRAFGALGEEGDLVGFAHIVVHPNTWNITECCYLEDLFVSEQARRQGVAKRLIEFVYQFAQKNHYHRVYWVTDESNKNAQALYEQCAVRMNVVQYRKSFLMMACNQ